MEKVIHFKKGCKDFVLMITQIKEKYHNIAVYESLDKSINIPFGIVSFFDGKAYGKIGTDYDRTKIMKLTHYEMFHGGNKEKIEHNKMVKQPAQQRAYSLIYEQMAWLSNVVHHEEKEHIGFYLDEL